MKITVVGGGNVGTLMAAEFAMKGHDVTVYTSRPETWQLNIAVYDSEDKLQYVGRLNCVTANMKEAIIDAELIFVTYPPFMFAELAKVLQGVISNSQKLIIVPGSGGVEGAFAKIIANGVEIWGLQRVPDIARLKVKGQSVYALGRKATLKLATIPWQKSRVAATVISGLFGIPCDPLPNYYCVTLSPSNQILHTSRLCSMFSDYKKGVKYDRQFLFYEEWDDASSRLLFKNDAELQKLCQAIPEDLSAVEPLPSYYESSTPSELTQKIRSIRAFKGIKTPMTRVDDGWIPDLSSRYFMADFPFGLNVIRRLARKYGVSTSSLDATWGWYKQMMRKFGK